MQAVVASGSLREIGPSGGRSRKMARVLHVLRCDWVAPVTDWSSFVSLRALHAAAHGLRQGAICGYDMILVVNYGQLRAVNTTHSWVRPKIAVSLQVTLNKAHAHNTE